MDVIIDIDYIRINYHFENNNITAHINHFP